MSSFAALVRKIWPLFIMAAMLLTANGVLAAEEGAGEWRPIYDKVMMWVNFLILVGIIFKFGKAPIKEFLANRRFDVANEIEQLEKQRGELQTQTAETMKSIETSKGHFAEMATRIIESGEKAKLNIIEDAKSQSQIMLDEAKRKIEAQISSARQNFRSELIDASVNLAMENIKGHMTPDDDQRFIDTYLAAVPDEKP